MRPKRAQEKTLSAERSSQVPKVPKVNSGIPADTFSPTQTADISIQVMREPLALKSYATLIGRRMDIGPARERRRQRGGESRSCQSERAWRIGVEPRVA